MPYGHRSRRPAASRTSAAWRRAWVDCENLGPVKRLLHDLDAIDWEDLFYKSLTIGAICAYLADRMWNREGLRDLLPVKRAMQAEYARTGAEMWVLALKSYDHLERRLRSRKRSR